MKRLKKYKEFLEKVEVKDTDQPDTKMAKEKMNSLEDNITEFNQKKTDIDNIFKNQSFDMKKIEEELKKLIGAEESGSGKDRNPFLVNYAEVSKLTRKVEDLQNSRADDKTKIDEFKQELSLSTDDGVKLNINSRISDIQNRLAEKSQEITELQKEIEIKKKEIDEKVANQRKEIEEFSNKIKEEEQK
jgi:hypothetical protein